MAQLPLSNVISISVSQANPGVGNFNTSNLAIFTDDAPANGWSGATLGYGVYLTPTQVGLDFGTSSKTYLQANAVFSQQPNILTGGGQLIIIPLVVAQQTLTFSALAASGTFVYNFGGHASAAINWNDTAAQIQTKIQAVTGCSQFQVSGSIASELLTITMYGQYGQPSLATISSNSVETSGSSAITITVATSVAGQSIGPAITAWTNTVQFFGVMANESFEIIGQIDTLAAAAVIQALVKLYFTVSNASSSLVATTGPFALVQSGSFTQTRCLYYGDSSENNDLVMMASYAGLALSVNFSGSNTTTTMHLKTLVSVNPDPTMTQTILNEALVVGADTYISLQGDSCVFTSGANSFYDQVYNLQWFTAALQVAGFNFLAQTGTKIPQTENGMDGLKGAYRAVCQQAVTNGYLAPGSWNSPTTFGNQTNLINNVAQTGYYIYSAPIASQSQTNRAARVAPLVQIAAKQAGAIQSSTVIVTVNA